jgi:hypothetical protein
MLPINETVASGGNLLSSISWTIPTLISIVNSTVSPSSRGFLLHSGVHKILKRDPSGGNTTLTGQLIQPLTANVSISISLPLDTIFASKLLSEKQSIVALLSSIVGLAGIISFFGVLLGIVDAFNSRFRAKIDGPTSGDDISFVNPMHEQGGSGRSSSRDAATRASGKKGRTPGSASQRDVMDDSGPHGDSAWEGDAERRSSDGAGDERSSVDSYQLDDGAASGAEGADNDGTDYNQPLEKRSPRTAERLVEAFQASPLMQPATNPFRTAESGPLALDPVIFERMGKVMWDGKKRDL